MLPKSQRLVTAEFDAVMKKGKVLHSPLFLLRYLESTNGTQVSAVVSQKVGKTAVVRSKTRRTIYEALRVLPVSSIKGVHGILFAKDQVLSSDQQALIADLKNLFVKAGLLR